MGRPTFTASDVARYVFCNLAWSYDTLGAPTKSPEEIASALEALRANSARTPQEEEELRYLERLASTAVRREAGEAYHARVHAHATTLGTRRVRRFVAVFILVFVLLLALLFLISLISP